MENRQDQISLLTEKLNTLTKRHNLFSKEISELREEISLLKSKATEAGPQKEEVKMDASPTKVVLIKEPGGDLSIKEPNVAKEEQTKLIEPVKEPVQETSFKWEKIIGENWLNKIGIVITIIGVAIGAKYSIEHELISPLTRIVLGYLTGIGLLLFGVKLKKKYENFSSVLVSGAMAIMYFMTFAAYSFYDLMPRELTFLLMVLFTAFTVFAALKYDMQVITLIGLVGAYAVPFLLSDGSGEIWIMFTYMTIINSGILIVAIKKQWNTLYISSFILTWLIFVSWFIVRYETDKHIEIALLFLGVFFVLFYLTFLVRKLVQKETLELADVVLLLTNTFIFYGVGYVILSDHTIGSQLLGLFTLFNALIHFSTSVLIYRQKPVQYNLLHLTIGLVFVFITIAIPIQLDGNWVTLLWVIEAALLFWLGRIKSIQLYEKLSYVLMFLACLSVAQDWSLNYGNYVAKKLDTKLTPIFNVHFLNSLLFIAAFAWINYVNHVRREQATYLIKQGAVSVFSYLLAGILVLALYMGFYLEIANYFDQLFLDSALQIPQADDQGYTYYWNRDIIRFKTIWTINYSLFFAALTSLVNFRWLKNQSLGAVNLLFNALFILFFLLQGLNFLSFLRESYLEQDLAEYYNRGIFHIYLRYVSYAFVIFTLVCSRYYVYKNRIEWDLKIWFDLFKHLVFLWLASSELIHILDLSDTTNSFKLGLTILWGLYALTLIGLGIWKRQQHLRIAAIALFGMTLIKLFFFDIAHLNTISKTIIFVTLGVLLLIISFLYNKYKHLLTDEETE